MREPPLLVNLLKQLQIICKNGIPRFCEEIHAREYGLVHEIKNDLIPDDATIFQVD